MDNATPATPPARPPVVVITCAVLDQEVLHFAQGLPHLRRIVVMEQGLHNDPPRLRRELQTAVDTVEAETDAELIVLGYGLCSRGTEEVSTRRCRLVVPRAHDCITLLLGSKERYAAYAAENPGTYWYSPGWNKHHTPPGPVRYQKLYDRYVREYGQDNAEFLMESEQAWFRSYSRATYVDLGVGATPADLKYTQDCAQWLKWSYDRQHGDPALLLALLCGPWDDERFLVLQPGQALKMTADLRVIEACPGCRGNGTNTTCSR